MAVAKPAPTATSPIEMMKTAARSSAKVKPAWFPEILMPRISLFIGTCMSPTEDIASPVPPGNSQPTPEFTRKWLFQKAL
jgi:hypothetical protein